MSLNDWNLQIHGLTALILEIHPIPLAIMIQMQNILFLQSSRLTLNRRKDHNRRGRPSEHSQSLAHPL